jgi:hypothetical protein
MAATLTLRSVKGSPLTNNEVDSNFTNLNTAISDLENVVGPSNINESISDIVGGMVSSNTESGITVTYQDTDNTLDFDVADFNITLTGDVSGSGTVTNLGNVSFVTTVADNSHNHIASNITDLSETIADTVGAMVSSNTESGISVTYQDGDNTLDFDVADFTLTFTGDATGSGTVTNLGNTSVALNISSIDNNLGVTGNITASGTVTAADFNTTSDISLKQNINVIDSALSKISQLNGYTFNWKNNDKEAVGIMAQEVEKVLPQIVATGEDGYKKVSYDSLIPLLIEAVKELSAKVK